MLPFCIWPEGPVLSQALCSCLEHFVSKTMAHAGGKLMSDLSDLLCLNNSDGQVID